MLNEDVLGQRPTADGEPLKLAEPEEGAQTVNELASQATSLAESLGCERGVVLHVDDLGMGHGANRAFLELASRGHVTCGSVMVPCPWFPEIAEAAAADPTLDLGVHLTLTSEWDHYRWAPVSTRSAASGLIDADGYFWRDVDSLARHVIIEVAEEELRAQIERALASGLRPTHMDAHMAAAMLPDLLDVHVRLALDYGLFPMLPRRLPFAPDPARYAQTITSLEARGLPVVDEIRGTLPVAEAAVRTSYERLIRDLPSGVTHLALHCTAPGEIGAISPRHASWRINEHRLFSSGAISRWCDEGHIAPIATRQLQQRWKQAQHNGPAPGCTTIAPVDAVGPGLHSRSGVELDP